MRSLGCVALRPMLLRRGVDHRKRTAVLGLRRLTRSVTRRWPILRSGSAKGDPIEEGTWVCRPGGTIGLVNWTPSGFIGKLLRTVGRHVPPPAGMRPPTLWGTEERLGELLGGAVSRLEVERRSFVWRFRSPDEFASFFRDNYGPVHKAFGALDEPGRQRFHDDLTALAREHDQEPGPSVAMPAEYLEVVATRR
jgi:hypothetical protein